MFVVKKCDSPERLDTIFDPDKKGSAQTEGRERKRGKRKEEEEEEKKRVKEREKTELRG